MLQVIFGDDEHTAADGPYTRILKTRKWLYLSSAAVIGLSSGIYNEKAANDALKIIALPSTTVEYAFAGGLVYLLIQYVFLVLQLWTTYDIILAERFTFRRADELTKARSRLKEAENAYNAAQHRIEIEKTQSTQAVIENLNLRISRSAAEVQTLEDQQRLQKEVLGLKGVAPATATRLAQAKADLEKSKAELADELGRRSAREEAASTASLQELDRLRADVQAASQDLHLLYEQVPANRRLYRPLEQCIDVMRIVPPAALALLALILLAKTW